MLLRRFLNKIGRWKGRLVQQLWRHSGERRGLSNKSSGQSRDRLGIMERLAESTVFVLMKQTPQVNHLGIEHGSALGIVML